MCQVTMVGMDEECLRSIQESKTLAGIFQSVVDDCKVSTLGLLSKYAARICLETTFFFIDC